jgi:hypothetical protein
MVVPVFASFILEFALQLRKKHGKTSVRVAEATKRIFANYLNQLLVYFLIHFITFVCKEKL